MVQMIQFLHMQGDQFHFLINVLNLEIFSIVLIPLLNSRFSDRVRRLATDQVVECSSPATTHIRYALLINSQIC